VLIAVTGYRRDADLQLSEQAGFDHHLLKPASFSDIKKYCRAWQARWLNGRLASIMLLI
jgi:CheY-like chemotaxis protein